MGVASTLMTQLTLPLAIPGSGADYYLNVLYKGFTTGINSKFLLNIHPDTMAQA